MIIGKRGTDIPVASAMDHVSGYLLCLDMTARELQEIAKKKGEPWSTAKGSDAHRPQPQRRARAEAWKGDRR